jgi:NADH-quinone oxidoreductase subunit C
MSEALKELGEYIALKLEQEIKEYSISFGELTLLANRQDINKVMRFLHDDALCQFINITDLGGVDYPGREKRFEIVYQLLSPAQNQRIRIKVSTDEETPIPSITEIFPGADWYEREAYDMFGILFSGHHDLRRLLTDYGFDGYPLRKDFPVSGYVELRYSEEEKRVVYEPVKLTQEFRTFDNLSPWEGTDYVLPGDEKAKS